MSGKLTGLVPPSIYSPHGISYPGETDKCTEEGKSYPEGWFKEHVKTFSKAMVDAKIQEYKNGKFSKKYIETYIDFAHFEGVIDNLKYMEYKNELKELEK